MAGHGEMAELRALLEQQARTIEALEARLAAVEAPRHTDQAGMTGESGGAVDHADGVGADLRTDRRGLLRQAGVAVAGVATGAVVLGQASPAAAAQGTFDGNPAVLGTANPNTGVGVRGDTITGIGVQGRSQAAAGPAIGVEGLVAGTLSTGVKGIATNAATATIGVHGVVASPDGIAVKAVNTSASGLATGVRAEVESPTGVGVVANNAATTGDATAVAGVTGSSAGIAVVGNALAATGTATGVAGTSSSNNGVGVKGTASASGGTGVTGAGGASGVTGTASASTGVGVKGTASAAGGTGVTGAGGAIGVSGTGTSKGVFGTSPTNNAIGVEGTATGGTGVAGTGNVGVLGTSTTGFGVMAASERAQVVLQGSAPPPLAVTLSRLAGELVLDTDKTLWLSIAAGIPGTWRRLGGAGTAGALTLLPTPVRVYDSRPGNNPATPPKTPIAGNTTRVIDTKNNSSGVPSGATGVLVTLTVLNGSASGGFLALFKAGAATPSTSSINWSGAGQVVATTTVSAVDTTAQVAVFCPPNSSTDFILDVIGYYQ